MPLLASSSKLLMATAAIRKNQAVPTYSPAEVDRIWAMWGSHYNIPKAKLYLLQGDYIYEPEI